MKYHLPYLCLFAMFYSALFLGAQEASWAEKSAIKQQVYQLLEDYETTSILRESDELIISEEVVKKYKSLFSEFITLHEDIMPLGDEFADTLLNRLDTSRKVRLNDYVEDVKKWYPKGLTSVVIDRARMNFDQINLGKVRLNMWKLTEGRNTEYRIKSETHLEMEITFDSAFENPMISNLDMLDDSKVSVLRTYIPIEEIDTATFSKLEFSIAAQFVNSTLNLGNNSVTLPGGPLSYTSESRNSGVGFYADAVYNLDETWGLGIGINIFSSSFSAQFDSSARYRVSIDPQEGDSYTQIISLDNGVSEEFSTTSIGIPLFASYRSSLNEKLSLILKGGPLIVFPISSSSEAVGRADYEAEYFDGDWSLTEDVIRDILINNGISNQNIESELSEYFMSRGGAGFNIGLREELAEDNDLSIMPSIWVHLSAAGSYTLNKGTELRFGGNISFGSFNVSEDGDYYPTLKTGSYSSLIKGSDKKVNTVIGIFVGLGFRPMVKKTK